MLYLVIGVKRVVLFMFWWVRCFKLWCGICFEMVKIGFFLVVVVISLVVKLDILGLEVVKIIFGLLVK